MWVLFKPLCGIHNYVSFSFGVFDDLVETLIRFLEPSLTFLESLVLLLDLLNRGIVSSSIIIFIEVGTLVRRSTEVYSSAPVYSYPF